MNLYHPFDGQIEEGAIPRPGFKYPLVYTGQSDGEGRVAWAIWSQGGRATKPLAYGTVDSLEEAREAAEKAAEKCQRIELKR
jgi:hypothetical protein